MLKYLENRPLVIGVSILLVFIGSFLMIDDLIFHWIIWTGADPFFWTEHWIYGLILIGVGIILAFTEFREWDECPRCGSKLVLIRCFNEEIMGTGDDNPYIGWICYNENCKGWWCEYCQLWHSYGTSCSVVMVRNIRSGTHYPESDPNWRHRYEHYRRKR
jgi:hypothetical protein